MVIPGNTNSIGNVSIWTDFLLWGQGDKVNCSNRVVQYRKLLLSKYSLCKSSEFKRWNSTHRSKSYYENMETVSNDHL